MADEKRVYSKLLTTTFKAMDLISAIAILAGAHSSSNKRAIEEQTRRLERALDPERFEREERFERHVRCVELLYAGVTPELQEKEEAWLAKRLNARVGLFFAILGGMVLLGCLAPAFRTDSPSPLPAIVTATFIFICWVVYRVRLGPEPALTPRNQQPPLAARIEASEPVLPVAEPQQQPLDLTDPANASKAERYRSRCLRYLWMKSGRPISANDTGFADPVTPIMETIEER